VAGVDACGHRRAVGRQAVLRERPRHHRRGAEHAGGEDGDRAQPQRHDQEPQADPEHERGQRSARVRQHQAHEQHAHRRPRERVRGGVARAARGQPQHRRNAQRRHQPD
jgi:hypothetical protein